MTLFHSQTRRHMIIFDKTALGKCEGPYIKSKYSLSTILILYIKQDTAGAGHFSQGVIMISSSNYFIPTQ